MAENPLAGDLDEVVNHTGPLWEELRGGRIFVTGGTGFIGCWLLESFAWANDRLGLGAKMLVLTRNESAFQKKAPHLAARSDIEFWPGDARDFKFPPGRFSQVIHAATEASAKLNEENPGLMLDTIVGGTRRALEFAVYSGANKFLLTSSGAVYGPQPPTMASVPEEYGGGPDVSLPGSAYGEGKRVSELLCALEARRHGLETKIARCFAFVGPYLPLDAHFAVGNFMRDAMAGDPILVRGDGAPFRSYLYAADLAAWLWTILFRGLSNRPYNVGSAHGLTIAETARAVAKVMGGTSAVSIAQKVVPDRPAQRYVPEVSRAKNELALLEWTPLEESIRRTVVWHQRKR